MVSADFWVIGQKVLIKTAIAIEFSTAMAVLSWFYVKCWGRTHKMRS